MRLLYIHPGMNAESLDYALIPMGAVGLVNLAAEAGCEVRAVNLPLERSLDEGFCLEGFLRDQRTPDVVLIDLHFYVTTAGTLDAARDARRTFPDALIVVGGLTATHFDLELLALCPEIDLVIRGPAEAPLLALVEGLGAERVTAGRVPNSSFRVDGAPVRGAELAQTSAALYERLDFVSLDWLSNAKEYYSTRIAGYHGGSAARYWLQVGRGCTFNCTMCGGGLYAHRELLGIQRPIYRSVGRIVDDLARLAACGVTQVAFSHDLFTLNYPELDDLVDEIVRRKLQIGVFHEFWRLPSPEAIQKMFRAFDPLLSEVSISPESGNEQVRKRNFPSKAFSNEDYLDWLSSLERLLSNSTLEVYFAANLPFESEETWKDSIRLMEQIADEHGHRGLIAYAGFLTIDPLSPMWHYPEKFEIVRGFKRLADYERMTRRGKRVPGYHSRHLGNGGLQRNLEAFRSAMEQRVGR